MPKIYVHYPAGAIANASLQALAEDLTTPGLECEHLPTPVCSQYRLDCVNEYPQDRIFVAGKPGRTPMVSIKVNVFEGGLDDLAKG